MINTSKILITGDFCPIGRNAKKIEREDYSFFGNIVDVIKSADLSVTNLELPITSYERKSKKTGPNIKSTFNVTKGLKKNGFDLVTMANNHILDYGEIGLKDTIIKTKESGLEKVGAGLNISDARSLYTKVINSVRIGVLNFAENEFSSAKGESGGANPVNPITNHYDIKEAKHIVDFLIVIAHGGREHYQLPTPRQRERYRFYIDSGADIVVGHHPHCYSGYENYNEKWIFYSLGNFIFDYKEKYQTGIWTEGFALLLTMNGKNVDFDLVPYFQGRKHNPDLVLMQDDEKEYFEKKIEKLNNIILDDVKFYEAWNDYVEKNKKNYKGMLLRKNDYVREAVNRGLLPDISFHSKRHQLLLLNLLRCETHNEIMTKVLENELLNH